MAPKQNELSELIWRAEDAEGHDRALSIDIWLALVRPDLPHGYEYKKECPDYTSSVSAAVTLCERVLPGWHWRIGSVWKGLAQAVVFESGATTPSPNKEKEWIWGKTPALALCLAILYALKEQKDRIKNV